MTTDDVPRTPKRLARLQEATPSPPRDLSEHQSRVQSARELFLKARQDRLAQRSLSVTERVQRTRQGKERTLAERVQDLRAGHIAAQAARASLYASISAQGSQRVAQAQRVARQQRERQEAAREAARVALQRKLAEAETRRLAVLQRRASPTRCRSPPGQVQRLQQEGTKVLSQEEQAARCIQRLWRRQTCRAKAKAFLATGLKMQMQDKSFEEVAALISSRSVIASTRPMLALCGLTTASHPAKESEATCRQFLAIYMLCNHPAEVLSGSGELEGRLQEEARLFAEAFSRWLAQAAAGDASRSQPVLRSWQSYLLAFKDWKTEDSAVLVEHMIAQFVELDLIWLIVKDSTEASVAEEYHEGIRQNQVLLLAKLRRILGDQARPMIGAALKKARSTRTKRSKKRLANADAQEQAGAGMEMTDFVSLWRRNQAPSNRQLVHELALDPSYSIPQAEPESPGEAQVKAAFYAFMQQSMASGTCPAWLPTIVQECKMRLQRLVMPNAPTFAAISKAFDMPFIAKQCERHCFDYLQCTQTMISMMKSLCAPSRDEAVAAIDRIEGGSAPELFVKRIDAIFKTLDEMLIDSANFHLRMATSTLLPRAVSYEQSKFDEDLQARRVSLDKTTRWLVEERRLLQSAHEEYATRQVVASALARSMVTASDLPETLRLDTARLSSLRKQAHNLIQVAALLTTARGLMATHASAGLSDLSWSALKARLVILCSAETDLQAMASEMERHFSLALPSTTSSAWHPLLTGLVTRCDADSGVVRLLTKRVVKQVAWSILQAQACPAAQVAAAGLSEVALELQMLCAAAGQIAALNMACYGQYYDGILNGTA